MDPTALGEQLPRLVDRIVASYGADPRTQHIDQRFLPAREVIVEICDLLLELTYPGYIGRKGLTQHNISYHVGELLPKLWDCLVEQMLQCLCHEDERHRGACSDAPEACRHRAAELAGRFMER